MLNRLLAPKPGLVFYGIKTSLIGSLNEAKCCSVLKAQNWFGERIGSAYLLKASCPPVLILGVGGGFIRRLRLSSDVIVLRGIIEGSLHCFFQLNVGLIW